MIEELIDLFSEARAIWDRAEPFTFDVCLPQLDPNVVVRAEFGPSGNEYRLKHLIAFPAFDQEGKVDYVKVGNLKIELDRSIYVTPDIVVSFAANRIELGETDFVLAATEVSRRKDSTHKRRGPLNWNRWDNK